MSNKDQKSEQDWKYVDKLTRKEYKSTTLDMVKGARPLEGLELVADKARKDKLSLVTRLKAGAIERKAVLEKMQVIYDAQLEATKHALRRAVDVEKERVDLIANKYIFEITEEYLRDMRDLGIHNYEARMQTLLALNVEVAKLLRQAQGQDVPEKIKETTISAIIAKYEEFSAQLVQEGTKLK